MGVCVSVCRLWRVGRAEQSMQGFHFYLIPSSVGFS